MEIRPIQIHSPDAAVSPLSNLHTMGTVTRALRDTVETSFKSENVL